MIVLDEQLLGRNIEKDIEKWYAGKVIYINELRPNTIIKDDAIPGLLRDQKKPVFITINEKDFWRKVEINERFCVICLVLPDSRVREIPELIRSLFRFPDFNTKSKRMGTVVRIADDRISYYTFQDKEIRSI